MDEGTMCTYMHLDYMSRNVWRFTSGWAWVTSQTSVFFMMTPHPCGPTCRTSDAPPCHPFSWLTDWLIMCTCVCAALFCLYLVTGIGALCRNGPLCCCLAGRPDPSGQRPFYHMKPKCHSRQPSRPLLQPFVLLCGSVCQETHTQKYSHKHTHLLLL